MLDNTAQHSTDNMKPTLTVRFDTSPKCIARAYQHMQLTVNAKRLNIPQHGSLAKSSPISTPVPTYARREKMSASPLVGIGSCALFCAQDGRLIARRVHHVLRELYKAFRTAHVRVLLRFDNRMPFLQTSETVLPVDRFPQKVSTPRAMESTCVQHMSGRNLAAIPRTHPDAPHWSSRFVVARWCTVWPHSYVASTQSTTF